DDWWRASVATVREVLAKTGLSPCDIKGIGLSGQMHGSVFLDGSHRVVRPAEPETYAKIRKVLLPKDSVRFRLTGEFHSEVSDASGTSFFHVRERRWATEMLDALELPRDWMPEVHESPVASA